MRLNFVKRLCHTKAQASWLIVLVTGYVCWTGCWMAFIGPALLVAHSFLQDWVERRPPYKHGQ